MKPIRDTWLVYSRAMILNLKQPVWLIVMLVQPLYFLFLFAPLLEAWTGSPALRTARWRRSCPGSSS
ncbi:MAG TPA: hypothetical protein VHG10_04245 [Glycomyces sp.]|nr:hypothetical protein [Glycomyces sp.]